MSRHDRRLAVALGLALVASVCWRDATVEAMRQAQGLTGGRYTAPQAARGALLYAGHCAQCHGPNLEGTDFGPGLAGPELLARWKYRSTSDLLTLMQATMPLTSPGGLSPQQNADILAYMLQHAKVPAGTVELVPVNVPQAGRSADARPGAAAPAVITYTEEQAGRGVMLFRRHCMFCHATNATNAKAPDQVLRGFVVGPGRMAMNLGGRSIRNYASVYHLFVRIRDAMPAWDIDSLSPAQKLDIVAYLLKEGGFPAGKTELSMDLPLLRRMPLADPQAPVAEPGFRPLFNGRDFTGIKFLFGMNCTPAPQGCGKTTPESFYLEEGNIVGTGRQHGYWYTDGKYLNFDLRLEYRWVPPPDHEPGDEHFSTGSSGYLLFVTEQRMWPRAIEVEGDNDGIMRGAGMATTIKQKYDVDAVRRANKGPGNWNEVRIVSSNGQIHAYLNGTLTNVIDHTEKEPGHIAFQYQGGTIMWRNIRIKAE